MFRSLSWVVVANLARQLSFLAVNAVLFERLSRPTFGAISLAFGYVIVFIGLGDFGIRQIGWRAIARQPERVGELTGPLLSAKAITVAMALALFVLMMPLLWTIDAPQSIYLLFGLGILFNAATFDFPLFGMSRPDLVAKFSLFAFLVYLASCLLLVREDSQAWLVPVIFSSTMCLLLLLQWRWVGVRCGGLRLGIGRAEFGRILRDSWPLGVGETLSRLAANYPLILIGLVLGSEGAGDYKVAELAYAFLAQFGHLIATASFSRLSHTFHHRRAEVSAILGKMLRTTTLAALAAGTLLAILGPRLVRVIFEGTTGETMSVLQILGAALVVAAPARMLKGLLPSLDKQAILPLVNMLTVAVGVAVGWAAVLAHGIVGMAIGVLTAELTALLYLLLVCWKSLRRPLTTP